jgi:hypothetical protein
MLSSGILVRFTIAVRALINEAFVRALVITIAPNTSQ